MRRGQDGDVPDPPIQPSVPGQDGDFHGRERDADGGTIDEARQVQASPAGGPAGAPTAAGQARSVRARRRGDRLRRRRRGLHDAEAGGGGASFRGSIAPGGATAAMPFTDRVQQEREDHRASRGFRP